jgi:hypothetical protein
MKTTHQTHATAPAQRKESHAMCSAARRATATSEEQLVGHITENFYQGLST